MQVLRTITGLQEILEIEEDNGLLEFACPDTKIPLWSVIRVPFLNLIIGHGFYGENANLNNPNGRQSSTAQKVISIARAFAHNAKFSKPNGTGRSIALMATGARLIKLDGNYFNALSDHFNTAKQEDTLCIEDLFGFKWPFPRMANNTMIHTPLRIEGAISGRIKSAKFHQLAAEMIDLQCSKASKLFGLEISAQKKDWLTHFCKINAASLPTRYRRYRSIFSKFETKLLIKEEACYGGADNAASIVAARDAGIVTAEYQHGAISSGHAAYNFGQAVINSNIYRNTLPDYLLTYGDWWSQQINAPVSSVSIGNPHREFKLRNNHPDATPERVILVLGDGIETQLYLDLCKKLAANLPEGYKIVFRPHPLERGHFKGLDRILDAIEIGIDSSEDIYSSFSHAYAVIGEVSTGLFDAIGLATRILVWDTPKSRFALPNHPFEVFADANVLQDLLVTRSAPSITEALADGIWAPNWRENYLGFIDRVIKK